MVLKIKNDEYVNIDKELEQKRDGINIDFKLNVFGNNPLSSLNQASPDENASSLEEQSPFAGFAQ